MSAQVFLEFGHFRSAGVAMSGGYLNFFGTWVYRSPETTDPCEPYYPSSPSCGSLRLATPTTSSTQLRAFNPYWESHAEPLEGLAAKPIHNDVDYVQAHLAEVLEVLPLRLPTN